MPDRVKTCCVAPRIWFAGPAVSSPSALQHHKSIRDKGERVEVQKRDVSIYCTKFTMSATVPQISA